MLGAYDREQNYVRQRVPDDGRLRLIGDVLTGPQKGRRDKKVASALARARRRPFGPPASHVRASTRLLRSGDPRRREEGARLAIAEWEARNAGIAG